MFFIRNIPKTRKRESLKVKAWGKNNRQIQIKEKQLYLC